MKQQLQQQLPNAQDVRIVGGTYPTPPARALAAKLFSTAFMVSLGVALAGQQLTFLPATVRNFIGQQRGMIVGGGFMLNMVGSSLGQTGAFEVTLDGKLIYSKLKAGTVPTVTEVRRTILEMTLLEKFSDDAGAATE